jgi:hypothetical protein
MIILEGLDLMSEPRSANSNDELEPAQLQALTEVPSGAVAIAGAAVLLLLIALVLIYALIYVPRGTVG